MVFIDTIYLLQVREFIGTTIYKIGRTQDIYSRYKSYPKNSILLFYSSCSNSVLVEKKIVNQFIKKYKQRRDIGTEYFEGDYVKMISDIINIISTDTILSISERKQIQESIQLRKSKGKKDINEDKKETIKDKDINEDKKEMIEDTKETIKDTIKITEKTPLLSFVHYIITDEKYKEDKILLSSDELLNRYNEFTNKYNIDVTFDSPISFILQLKKLQIKGITFGVRFRSKKIDTIKFDINKTEFSKTEIKKYLLLHFPLLYK